MAFPSSVSLLPRSLLGTAAGSQSRRPAREVKSIPFSADTACSRPHGYDAAGRDRTPAKRKRRGPMRLRSFGLLVCVMCASCVQAAQGPPAAKDKAAFRLLRRQPAFQRGIEPRVPPAICEGLSEACGASEGAEGESRAVNPVRRRATPRLRRSCAGVTAIRPVARARASSDGRWRRCVPPHAAIAGFFAAEPGARSRRSPSRVGVRAAA